MRIDWEVPVEMDDGLVLRCDVFRPVKEGRYPVIITYGIYGKWLHFEDGYPEQWRRMVEQHPDVAAGSSNKYQNWEVVDPEKWVPDGYACVRVDSRGAGRSPGYMDPFSERETRDFYECIEWAGAQPWSNGKVGANGISYYAINQWQVACLKPPHLVAMCAWEGAADFYRDMNYHGGIYCTFTENWYQNRGRSKQHGLGERGYKSRVTGDWVSGPDTLSDEELGANRCNLGAEMRAHPLDDEYWRAKTPDWSKVEVPFLSSNNWGGQGLHPRGNCEAFMRAASEEKWLESHGIEHWTEFYTDYGVALQKKFFGHYLKGEDTGWKDQPRVLLQIRHPGEKFVERAENEWPLARTNWTKLYLHTEGHLLGAAAPDAAGSAPYPGVSEGVTLGAPPVTRETDITGPLASKLWVSSATEDADLFLVLRVFTPDFREVTFQGALDPHTPVAQGWLRASHRKLDDALTLPYRPYHAHDEAQPLTPGEIYELDVEIWPTCIVIPKGYRLALSIRGCDYVYPGGVTQGLPNMPAVFSGVGPFRHNDPADRPPEVFGGEVTIHTGPGHPSHVLLPIIPPE
ncbi:MAG: CocE/NonD family hydrolase [Nitrospinae bacterium]|nr:CocE/NonD family hydrolase [Nitrospinota bacterium]